MEKLKGSQRKWLRGQAHGLRPVVQIGQKGLSEAALREVDAALDVHELIKIQAPGPKEDKQEIARRIEEELGAQAVGLIGHMILLYRRNPDPEKRRIELPGG